MFYFKKLNILLFLSMMLLVNIPSFAHAMDPEGNQKKSAPIRSYFKPEEAPTERLKTWVHFWDCELGLQMKKYYPHYLYVHYTGKFIEYFTKTARALGEDEDLKGSPLTTEEATFLLNHRAPI